MSPKAFLDAKMKKKEKMETKRQTLFENKSKRKCLINTIGLSEKKGTRAVGVEGDHR